MTTANDRTGQPLTPQEVAACVAIADGSSNQEIADQFHISLAAAGALVGRVFDKVGVRERGHLIAVLCRAEVIAFDDAGRPVPGPGADRPVPAAAQHPSGGFWMVDQEITVAERAEQHAAAVAEAENRTAGTT